MNAIKLDHTPLPWEMRRTASASLAFRITPEDPTVYGHDHLAYVVETDASFIKTYHPEIEANAKFIVKACNSYYELVKALTEIERDSWADPGDGGGPQPQWQGELAAECLDRLEIDRR